MNPFYSVSELADIAESDCFSVADSLKASGVVMLHDGSPADLTGWRRPNSRSGDGSVFVTTGTYPVPNPEHVIVPSELLPDLWKNLIAGKSNCNDAPLPTSRAHVSDKLAKLNQAAAKFWGNADRDDRGTHEDNATVAAWLVKQGFSPTLAEKAATIIRPEWAPPGRKPEE